MMLQALAGRDVQGRAFVLMGLCGVAMGLLIHAGAGLHRWRPAAGHALDAVTALVLLVCWQQTLLWCRTHPRPVQLLGLGLGLLLYALGAAPLVRRMAQKSFRCRKECRLSVQNFTEHRHEGGGMTDGSRSQGG